MFLSKKRKRNGSQTLFNLSKKTNLNFLPSSLFVSLIFPYLLWWEDWKREETSSSAKSFIELNRKYLTEILKCFTYTVLDSKVIIQNYLENVYRWNFVPKTVLKCKYCVNPNLVLNTLFNFKIDKNQDFALEILNYFRHFSVDVPLFCHNFPFPASEDNPRIENYDIYINFLFHRIFYTTDSNPELSGGLRTHLWNFTLFTALEFLCYEANFKIVVKWDNILKYIYDFRDRENEKSSGTKIKLKDIICVLSKGKNQLMPRELRGLLI